MLNKAFKKHKDLKGLILCSDKGCQYQMSQYHSLLKKHEITKSMSCKGNCLDNSPIENFFGRKKNEMFYGHEYEFTSIKHLIQEIKDYIFYYNNERI